MTRAIHLLIAAAYLAAAALVAALILRFAGADAWAAWMAAGLVAGLAAQLHGQAAQRAARAALESEIARLRAADADRAGALAAADRRILALQEALAEEAKTRDAALAAEVRTIEGLVRTMGERMDRSLRETRRTPPSATRSPAQRAAALAAVRDALEAGRVDLHLQPIVALPQRRTVAYESFSRLRAGDGRLIMPAEWLDVAEAEGLVTAVDNLLLFRCVQVVRRLARREKAVAIFCNVSIASFEDEGFFPQFMDFMRANSDLAGALVFEIGQAAFEGRSPTAARNIARLADFGFRFSIDKVDSLDMDLAELKRAGVRFVKVPGALLNQALQPGEPAPVADVDVRAEDYPDLLARYGVSVVAEKIEDERTVIEVLDREIAWAQGHLFGAPRPIRAELIAPEAERTAAAAAA